MYTVKIRAEMVENGTFGAKCQFLATLRRMPTSGVTKRCVDYYFTYIDYNHVRIRKF